MFIPSHVEQLMNRLEEAGFEAWAVGGCVRDDALGIKPHDYDLCSNALPEQLQGLFSDFPLVLSGMKHGTVGVVTHGDVVEITTFRTEGDYSDNRHPGWVEFVPSIDADLARRDFAINAMAYSPIRGYADPFGGLTDLREKRLRAVGDPARRFQEDALRILRGARFAARFGLTIDPRTKEAMLSQRENLDALARERVFSELSQFLTLASAENLVEMEPILTQVIPELSPCVGFDQKNPNHIYDVFTHMAVVTGSLPRDPVLRFAGILHDIGKPQSMTVDDTGKGHFYGHADLSSQIADTVLRRLKAPTAFREDVVWLIAHHMSLYSPEEKCVRRALSKHGIRRLRLLAQFQQADMGGKGTPGGGDKRGEIWDFLEEAEKRNAQEGRLSLKTLAIGGDDLAAVGYPRNRQMGDALNRLLELVIAGAAENEKQALLELAKSWL